ncbi:MAG: DUF2142 domain-containing protein, partial [Catenulispora sp.]|nr:DUF2142 domain-containing protein [Catenulispora sp.]
WAHSDTAPLPASQPTLIGPPPGLTPAAAPPPPPPASAWRRAAHATARFLTRPWFLALIGFFLMAGSWSFASPLATSPDEPSHIVKAAATARGEFVNSTSRHEVKGGFEKTWLGYPLPAKYATLDAMSACFRNKIASAACGRKFGTDETRTIVETSAGNYNPAYYLPVGLPSLFLPGVSALYGMRLVSALLNSALLAAAVGVAAGWRRPGWPIIGVVACGTPMTLFLSGTVNSNGMEATAAVLAWTAGMSLALDDAPRPGQTTRRAIALAVGGVLLANTRSLGVLFTLSVLVALAIVAGPRMLGRLLRHHAVQTVLVVLAAGAATAIAWNRYSDRLTAQPLSFPDLTPGVVANEVFFTSGTYIIEVIGTLGWLDVRLPPGSIFAWYAVAGLLVLVALGCARWREALVVTALVVGTVLIPILAQVSEARRFGIGWQGRYILAWVVGLPVLAGLLVARRVGPALPGALERRVPATAAIVLGLAGIGAFYWSMTRYAHSGLKKYGIYPILWAPPGGWIIWWVAYVLGIALLVVAVTVRRRDARWQPTATPSPT